MFLLMTPNDQCGCYPEVGPRWAETGGNTQITCTQRDTAVPHELGSELRIPIMSSDIFDVTVNVICHPVN